MCRFVLYGSTSYITIYTIYADETRKSETEKKKKTRYFIAMIIYVL